MVLFCFISQTKVNYNSTLSIDGKWTCVVDWNDAFIKLCANSSNCQINIFFFSIFMYDTYRGRTSKYCHSLAIILLLYNATIKVFFYHLSSGKLCCFMYCTNYTETRVWIQVRKKKKMKHSTQIHISTQSNNQLK